MKLEWKNKTAKTLTLAHFICFLENNGVGQFLLKPEILCLLFKQCCQIQNFVKSPKIALSDKILQKQNFGSCLKSKQRTSGLNRNLSKQLFFREQMKWDFVKALTPLVGLNRQIRRSWEGEEKPWEIGSRKRSSIACNQNSGQGLRPTFCLQGV